MKSSLASRSIALAVSILAFASTANSQSEVLYITNGDAASLQGFQGGNMVINTTTVTIAYPIVVRNTIWIGDRDNGGGSNKEAGEYDLAGIATGNTAVLEGVDRGNFVDGAVNENINYTLDAFTGTAQVYSTNADWTNPVPLFTVPGSILVGITFDPVSGNLFISDTASIYEYTLGGALLSQFSHSGGNGCLAYEVSTDTLWYVPNSSTAPLLQYSKDGALLQSVTTPTRSSNVWGAEFQSPVGKDVGTNYCGPANLNSTGQSAEISGFGSDVASSNFLELTASLLPQNKFGYFLNSQTQDFKPFAGGSNGNLCLGQPIGRHVKQIQNTGAAGEFTVQLDLSQLPTAGGPHTVVAGETWNFQAWFRDTNSTSNFTDGLSILFL